MQSNGFFGEALRWDVAGELLTSSLGERSGQVGSFAIPGRGA